MKRLITVLTLLASLTSTLITGQITCPPNAFASVDQFGLKPDDDTRNDSIIYTLELNETLTTMFGTAGTDYSAVDVQVGCSQVSDLAPTHANVVGQIERTFKTLADNQTCRQYIWLTTDQLFTEELITWPQDLTLPLKEYSRIKVRDEYDWGAYVIMPDSAVLAFAQMLRDSMGRDVQVYINEKSIREKNRAIEKALKKKSRKPTYHRFMHNDLDTEFMAAHKIGPQYIEPILIEPTYSLIGRTYTDMIFNEYDTKHPKKLKIGKIVIHREWSIVDWCTYDPRTNAGLYYHTQVITLE